MPRSPADPGRARRRSGRASERPYTAFSGDRHPLGRDALRRPVAHAWALLHGSSRLNGTRLAWP